ncbi:hypothetical protein RSOL_126020 [Rhizoctonia solani AG-3 Rhs1AP]|uniref:Uncharacterized protein n=1 Tax=Rhizoctonia solani AG-3 Rhs1AP TaxID=1086054 RepID=X8IZY4_9AGAM|nr:hypothetical protein RSOL_126020 [Rhizoctonia solani AG-3 Rhs1AP]
MSSNINMRSSLRSTEVTTTICVARQGKLCRCGTCNLSFVSTTSIVSDVSTTCPPLQIYERENCQDTESPWRARCQPLQAFPSNSTIVDFQETGALAGGVSGPSKSYRSPNQNLFNLPRSRAQSLASTDSVSSVASDRTVCPPKINALKRKEIVSNAATNNNEDDEPSTPLPPLPAPFRSLRTQRLGPTRSNYNLTPTPAIPLGRPKNRRRFD